MSCRVARQLVGAPGTLPGAGPWLGSGLSRTVVLACPLPMLQMGTKEPWDRLLPIRAI